MNKKQKIWNGFLLVFLISLTNSLQAQDSVIRGNGQINFLSDAPLELIQARSTDLLGIIDTSNNQFAFSISIRSFDGFNSPLQQEHFNENYLESDQYPKATFTGKIIEDLNFDQIGKQEVRAKGNLEIHGVKVHRIIPSTIEMVDDKIQITSEFLVPLLDHDIRIPKIVYMKIAEQIQVDVNITFVLE